MALVSRATEVSVSLWFLKASINLLKLTGDQYRETRWTADALHLRTPKNIRLEERLGWKPKNKGRGG